MQIGPPVRALVRNEDDRSRHLQSLGAEVFVGDLLDFRSVQSAFHGIKQAYFVYPIRPGLVQATHEFRPGSVRSQDRVHRQHVAEDRPPRRKEQLGASALAGRTSLRQGRDAGRKQGLSRVRDDRCWREAEG
ncbi:NmrA family NAD(P)-binding protein [Rhizobium mayense]|uniref:NmrA family NAD(P)-binding protein n=1 Tax=Rhizobium mayense TaxID=1312184 RepID=UPI003D80AC83